MLRKRLSLAVAVILTAVLVPAAAFAGTQVPNTSGAGTPHAAVYNSTLYLFYGNRNFVSSVGGSTWSTSGTVPMTTDRTLYAGNYLPVAFNGRLYAFWPDYGDSKIYYTSMDQFGVWTGTATQLPGASIGSTQIGLCVFNNRLYAMWRATVNNTSLFYASMDTNGTWSSTAHLSTAESADGPAAAVMTGADGVDRMWAIWEDRYDGAANPMWYASMTGTTWSSTTKLNTSDFPLTRLPESLASSGSRLYLAYKGANNNDVVVKQMDNSGTWYNEQVIEPLGSGYEPAIVWYNGAGWLFYTDNSHNVLYDLVY